MTTRQLIDKAKELLAKKEAKYKQIKALIKYEDASFSNSRYLRLQGTLAALKSETAFLYKSLRQLRHTSRVEMVVAVQSKIKLVSTKVGAVIWVDAKNYIDFVGKSIGDVVVLYNSPYLIAGIY